jgi:hypothetical protein
LTAEVRYGFGLTACVRANAKNRFGRLGNTVTAFVIRNGQVINALDEKQGSWWEYRDAQCEPFST